jgi:hypothetical protein
MGFAALPFEHPKLAVVASVGDGRGFAAQLEAALKRSGKLIEGRAIAVEPHADFQKVERFRKTRVPAASESGPHAFRDLPQLPHHAGHKATK